MCGTPIGDDTTHAFLRCFEDQVRGRVRVRVSLPLP